MLAASPTSDEDGDGLFDVVETNTGVYNSASDTGTDPFDSDTDDDGLLDGVEDNTGVYVSPTQTGTNPFDWDSDNDGQPDGYEVKRGSDPNDPQSIPVPALGIASRALLLLLLGGAGTRRLMRRRRGCATWHRRCSRAR